MENLSTFPGFSEPIVPVDAGADVLRRNKVIMPPITLYPSWYSKGVAVPLPLLLWNGRCLILNGLANADVLDEDFKAKGRRVKRVDPSLKADAKGSYAWVQLYGSDYRGTTLGPFKAVFTLTSVEGDKPDAGYFMWARYFGTSLINKEFKEKVWGIVPNHLAVVETAYEGEQMAVCLLEEGRPALRMRWNSARFPDRVLATREGITFKTVAPGRTDSGENEIELGAVVLKHPHSDDDRFTFDDGDGDDQFYFDPSTELGRDLGRIDFKPSSWQCMMNYAGVVKIYDEHGSGTPPKTLIDVQVIQPAA
jgi:hypothetical protein